MIGTYDNLAPSRAENAGHLLAQYIAGLEVRLRADLLPFESTDPITGERGTVHAVRIGRVLIVSPAAYDAMLAAASE